MATGTKRVIDLDTPLLNFGGNGNLSQWTIRNAVEGVQIFGGIGSGKTSGSGKTLATKLLQNKFGGLVLTAKPDEKDLWIRYCRDTNRLDDLIIIEPGGEHSFNFLEYEARKSENNKAITENIVEVLKTVIRAGDEKNGGNGDDAFWETALDMLIGNAVDLCLLAFGKLSVEKLFNVVQSLPKANEPAKTKEQEVNRQVTAFENAYELANKAVQAQINEWREKLSPEIKAQIKDQLSFEEALFEAVPDARLFNFLAEFFYNSFKNLSSKTRSIIEFLFSGFLYRLLRDPVYTMFCKNTTVTPEDCFSGKIILINLPVKRYHKMGRDCQILFKYVWQRAMEKRQIDDHSLPVFLFADEAHSFIHEHDAEYQATARSSRIITIYISQNLPNYYASMGGDKAEYRVQSFLGTLSLKLFHANADIETNRYSSDLIGEAFFTDPSMSITVTSKEFSQGQNMSVKLQKRYRPEDFVSLKTGGPAYSHNVEAIAHRQGTPLSPNGNHAKINFKQTNNH